LYVSPFFIWIYLRA